MKKNKRISESLLIALILNELISLLPLVRFNSRVERMTLFILLFLSVNEVFKN